MTLNLALLDHHLALEHARGARRHSTRELAHTQRGPARTAPRGPSRRATRHRPCRARWGAAPWPRPRLLSSSSACRNHRLRHHLELLHHNALPGCHHDRGGREANVTSGSGPLLVGCGDADARFAHRRDVNLFQLREQIDGLRLERLGHRHRHRAGVLRLGSALAQRLVNRGKLQSTVRRW